MMPIERAIEMTSLRTFMAVGVVHLKTPYGVLLCDCKEAIITVYELAPWFKKLPLHEITCLWCLMGRSRIT